MNNNIQKSPKITRDINIMIYAMNIAQLWEIRDMCHEIEADGFYKIHLTLTKDEKAAIRVSSFLQMDIIISTAVMDPDSLQEFISNIIVKNPLARFIAIRNRDFICSYKNMDGIHVTEESHMKNWNDFVGRFRFCIARMLEDKDLCTLT